MLLHELHVHQIELEIQNEELRRAEQAAATATSRYQDLYDYAPAGYFTFDPNGLIAAVKVLPDRDEGKNLRTVESVFAAFC